MFGIKPSKFTEFAGWYGVIAVIGAYAMVTFGIIDVGHFLYPLLNITGAIGFIIVAASKKVLQTVVMNIIWALIALISVVRLLV